MTTMAFLVGCNILVPLGLYFTGNASITTVIIVAAWGILYAPGVLIAMSSISSAAPEALEFANGLTASFANFGVTAGRIKWRCGLVIIGKKRNKQVCNMHTHYS